MIVISSPAPGDGKSVTAINTAGALALESEAAVLLVDADLRKPALHKQLGLPQSPGLADVLAGACALEDALVHTKEFPNLYAMSSGTTSANLVELLDSKQWRAVCTRLRGMFRYVIIDSPPVAAVADYALIQDVCDGVILVVRPYWTNRNLCRQALDLVPKGKFLGVLLNRVPDWPLAGQAARTITITGAASGTRTRRTAWPSERRRYDEQIEFGRPTGSVHQLARFSCETSHGKPTGPPD